MFENFLSFSILKKIVTRTQLVKNGKNNLRSALCEGYRSSEVRSVFVESDNGGLRSLTPGQSTPSDLSGPTTGSHMDFVLPASWGKLLSPH